MWQTIHKNQSFIQYGHCLSGSLIQLFLWGVLHISGGSSDSTFVNSFMPSTINLYQTLPSESPTENEQFLVWECFHFQPTKSLCWRLDFACGQFSFSFPPFCRPLLHFCTFGHRSVPNTGRFICDAPRKLRQGLHLGQKPMCMSCQSES